MSGYQAQPANSSPHPIPCCTTVSVSHRGELHMNLSRRRLAFAAAFAAITVPFIAAQDKREENCGGLHAAIRAELVRRDPPYTQPPFVMLSFILLNDSEVPINAVEGGWRIVIDGKELKDSDFIFGNGPHPTGGYGTLKPGESYELGKGLELSRYFPEEREYKVSWKGKRFQSSTITISVSPKQ